jgi:hypothetical protein
MSLTPDGFMQKSWQDRLTEIINSIKTVIPNIDMSEGEWLYQLAKIIAMREDEMQTQIQLLVDNMSIPLSYGEYLTRNCANLGVFRKYGEFSIGSVKITGSNIGTVVPKGTSIVINDNKYQTTLEVSLPTYFSITRGSENYDDVPEPNILTDANYIADGIESTSHVYSGWIVDDNKILWDEIDTPPEGETYYVFTPSYTTVFVSVTAIEAGSDYNVSSGASGSSTEFPDLDIEVYNDIVGGTDIESDDALKTRAVSGRYRARNKEWYKTTLENFPNISEVSIDEVLGTDKSVPLSWENDEPADGTEIDITGWTTASQMFSPSDGIASMRGVDIVIKKPYAVYSGIMKVSLLDANDVELKYKYITEEDLDSAKTTGAQTVFVELPYGPIYNTSEYRVNIYQEPDSDWILCGQSDESWNDGNLVVTPTGSQPGGAADLEYRIKWLSNAFNINVVPVVGYDYETVKDDIEATLNTDDAAFGIAGIQHQILLADYDEIQVRAILFTKQGFSYTNVVSAVETSLVQLFTDSPIGENIPYLAIIGAIMNVAGVKNLQNIYIYKDGTEVSNNNTQLNMYIAKGHKPTVDSPATVMTHGNP